MRPLDVAPVYGWPARRVGVIEEVEGIFKTVCVFTLRLVAHDALNSLKLPFIALDGSRISSGSSAKISSRLFRGSPERSSGTSSWAMSLF
jgi:hypothetical protein